MKRLFVILAILLASTFLALAATGCGGDDSDSGGDEPAQTQPADDGATTEDEAGVTTTEG